MTKKQWLNQTIMCDEWGRPPSLADVPLTYMPRKKAFEKRGYTKEVINETFKVYKEYLKSGEPNEETI
tara:strand:- start:3473 stop:3676 length:204 start_codon:yes stop_codon:yes gene_type:complete